MTRNRLTAVFLVLAGVFFILFPLIRPFFDESTIRAAAGFSSARWILAHASGMAGFILPALGFVVYIPQLQGAPFFQPIRIVVGLVILAGCVLISQGILSKANEVR